MGQKPGEGGKSVGVSLNALWFGSEKDGRERELFHKLRIQHNDLIMRALTIGL